MVLRSKRIDNCGASQVQRNVGKTSLNLPGADVGEAYRRHVAHVLFGCPVPLVEHYQEAASHKVVGESQLKKLFKHKKA